MCAFGGGFSEYVSVTPLTRQMEGGGGVGGWGGCEKHQRKTEGQHLSSESIAGSVEIQSGLCDFRKHEPTVSDVVSLLKSLCTSK